MSRPSVFVKEFADPYGWKGHPAWASHTHNEFVIVSVEHGYSLFKSFFVAGSEIASIQ